MEKTLTYGNISTVDFGNLVTVILIFCLFFQLIYLNVLLLNLFLNTYYYRQQFIKQKKDQVVSLETLMKRQMQKSISKEHLMMSRLGL